MYVPRELLESWKGRTKPDVDFLQSADRMKDPLVLANSTVLHSGYYGCIAVDKSVLLQTVQVVVQGENILCILTRDKKRLANADLYMYLTVDTL